MKLQGKFSGVRFVSLAITMMGALSVFAATAQATTFIVTNTNNSGAGSLAQAILDANANPGADTINFNIPGGGVQTISPTSPLPTITDTVIIDGYTQPGANPNSLALGTNAVLLIELSGVSANSPQGLKISAGNSTIRGLVINRFNSYAIYIYSNGGNVITGNYIGTDFTGSADFPRPNNGTGVFMNTPNNTIGGSSPADRNVIAGNRNACCSTGVYVDTASAKGNKVLGNYIGTNASGLAAMGNMGNGIVLSGSSQTIIGGLTAAERNVFAGSYYGITVWNASSNQIIGNYIGTLADGTTKGWENCPVNFGGTSKDNTLGGTTPGSGNVIAWHNQGVFVDKSAINNAILGNSIHDTPYYPAIDLYSGSLAVTPNDDNTGDADTGANNLQNFPVITSVVANGGTTTLAGTLDSAFNTTFRIELFSNQACHPSGFGEGENYLGFTTVTTDANGKGAFVFNVPTANAVGGFFTATATDPNGNTSEFSACTSTGIVAGPGTLQLSTIYIGKFENDGSFNINVTRTSGSAGTVTVNYATADGTATAPLDYTSMSGTLVFNDGETSKPISIPINDNNVPEGSHFFTITLSSPTGGAVLGNITKTQLSIQDNDYPTVSINDVSKAEGNSGTTAFTFTVTSSDAITNDVLVNYTTADGTAAAGSDYQPATGQLKIPSGQKTATVTIQVQGDTNAEA
ncbi:MAG TPA: Calx-beta domain-containing protein, partial [Pyrinomonadaceae bacterium]|nr:Calx-beta domain-containing protein [Pyrinomonadaceae bacterium]